jgi:phospholipid transport system substrate-binding protein
MKKKRTFILHIIAVYIFTIVSFATAASAPTDALKASIDSILEILRNKNLAQTDKKAERRSQIRAIIRNRFDFREMARRSLAANWKKRSSEEQKEFVEIFSDLLQSSYIGKIEGYTDEKITYDKEVLKKKGRYGVVSTTIVAKDVNIPIDYKLILKNDKWWVYDVVVEGVSFISTYRSQYNRVIKRESYAVLIEKMKSKLNEINSL